MIGRACIVLLLLVLSASGLRAQEIWSGRWAQLGGPQGGTLEFIFSRDGTISGNITNNGVVGLWTGFIRNDGVMFADYAYPGFGARAVGRILDEQGDVVVGRMAFLMGDQVFAEGEFQLRRSATRPQGTMEGTYPFTGDGMYVYCGAASICGRRGLNALPGNWGWTSGLFGDLKRSHPHVWCNLFPGSC
jgi:hypothetical protein